MPTSLPPEEKWPATIRMLASLAVSVPLRLTARAISPPPVAQGGDRAILARQRLKAVLALLATAKRVQRWADPDLR